MTQPLGDCPGCGADEPFEQAHTGWECPDLAAGAADCTEWVCSGCGAGVFMGTVITGTSAAAPGGRTAAPARASARAA